jgi:alpha-L-fucosidase 2
MSTSAKRFTGTLAIVALLSPSSLAADVKNHIGSKLSARHDRAWNKIPTKWGEGAFTGDGLPGLTTYATDDGRPLRFRVGRSDVMIQEKQQACRVQIGDLVLSPVGKIAGGNFRQDLWDAEVTGAEETISSAFVCGSISFR